MTIFKFQNKMGQNKENIKTDHKENFQASHSNHSNSRQKYERQCNEVKSMTADSQIANNNKLTKQTNKRKHENEKQTETKTVSMYNHVAQDLIITVDPETKGAIHKLLITKLFFVLKTFITGF